MERDSSHPGWDELEALLRLITSTAVASLPSSPPRSPIERILLVLHNQLRHESPQETHAALMANLLHQARGSASLAPVARAAGNPDCALHALSLQAHAPATLTGRDAAVRSPLTVGMTPQRPPLLPHAMNMDPLHALRQADILRQQLMNISLANPAGGAEAAAAHQYLLPRPPTQPDPSTQVPKMSLTDTLDFLNQTFPVRLFRLVYEAEQNNQEHIIQFNQAGDAILLHDREALMRELVPNHLRLTNFASFRRQMCMYGFEKRCHSATITLEYRHECFHRDRPMDLARITRRG